MKTNNHFAYMCQTPYRSILGITSNENAVLWNCLRFLLNNWLHFETYAELLLQWFPFYGECSSLFVTCHTANVTTIMNDAVVDFREYVSGNSGQETWALEENSSKRRWHRLVWHYKHHLRAVTRQTAAMCSYEENRAYVHASSITKSDNVSFRSILIRSTNARSGYQPKAMEEVFPVTIVAIFNVKNYNDAETWNNTF